MDLGMTALGNWKAQQGGCTHIQVSPLRRCFDRGRHSPPPLFACSSSTRSTTSSAFPLSSLTLTWTCQKSLLTHPSPPAPRIFASAFPGSIEKGAQAAAWNSPSTTSDKTSSWRCAAFPHRDYFIFPRRVVVSKLVQSIYCSPFVYLCIRHSAAAVYFIFNHSLLLQKYD
jgi:hypothetical protein